MKTWLLSLAAISTLAVVGSAATPCSRFSAITGGVEFSGTASANFSFPWTQRFVYLYLNAEAGVPFSVTSVFDYEVEKMIYASEISVNAAPGPSSFQVSGNRFIRHVPATDACYAVAIDVSSYSFVQTFVISDASTPCAVFTSLGPQFSGDDSLVQFMDLPNYSSKEFYYNAKKGVQFQAFGIIQAGEADLSASIAEEMPKPRSSGTFKSSLAGSDNIQILPTEDTCYAFSIYKESPGDSSVAQIRIAFVDEASTGSDDSSESETSDRKDKNRTILIAAIVGPVLFAALLVLGAVLYKRRRNRSAKEVSVQKPLNTESVVAGSVQLVQGESGESI